MTYYLLFRADDLGYSEAVNYGIEKSVKSGLIRSVGVMVNMPATAHGVQLIKDCDIACGLHINICAGKPLSHPDSIPSLVDDAGDFHTSKVFRHSQEDFVTIDEAVIEIEAQYKQFVALFGREPDYIDGHAVRSANFYTALAHVADKYQLKYSGVSWDNTPIRVGQSMVQYHMGSTIPDYDPFTMVKGMIAQPPTEVVQLAIFHPGYLDAEILRNSSLTIPRTQEVAMLIDPQTREWLAGQPVKLIDYREL